METKKKRFYLYLDNLSIRNKLSLTEKGELLEAICCYHECNPIPELSPKPELIFEMLRQQFERDNIKYLEACEKHKESGKMGGRPKNQNNQNGFSITKHNQTKPDKDKDKDKEKEKVKDTEKEKEKVNVLMDINNNPLNI